VVADLELGHGGPDGSDLAGQLAAGDPLLRSPETGEEARDERLRRAVRTVAPIDRRGVDPYEHFVLLRDGPFHLFESQDVRWPVPVVDDRPHR
jgi:hypothetical protein